MKLFTHIKGKAKATLITLVAVALPLAGIVQAQSNDVLLEGNTQSLNVTAGETEYSDSTDAKVDEVVQVQVWLHNQLMPEAENAENTRVAIDVPNDQGETQVVTGTISADNANTVVDDTTLNLSLERARVEYMEGTAKYRYNAGAAEGRTECETGMDYPADDCYETIEISDDIALSDDGVNLDDYRGGSLKGCNAHHETVTIQVRVVADVVSVNKFVRHAGEGSDDWTTSTEADPGDVLEYMIRFKNEGNSRLEDVVVADNLPKYHKYIDGSTQLMSGAFPNGTNITSDNIVSGGIDVGNYQSGAVGYVMFEAEIAPIGAYDECNLTYDLRNVGIVQPAGMNEHYNTAQVLVRVDCAEEDEEEPVEQALVCEMLDVSHVSGNTYEFTTSFATSGGATQDAFIYNFGDGSNELTTDQNPYRYTYDEAGTYTIRVAVRGEVDGSTEQVTSDACRATVKISEDPKEEQPEEPEQPTELPVTGPASIAGLFTMTTLMSAAAHRVITRRS